ncbi:NADPH:quinone reductase [Rhodococcus koreensis]|uniref:NADPH:quinone reductase n=2 Tax=Rhodococcus koreensis TaxID=99653 RepID=A0A1H4I6T6_9NOCA|nr:NADPH:quinone reductase [Rhodococcus koreensis]
MNRAVTVSRFGGPEVIEVVKISMPHPGPGEARVKVEAASVHPVDLETRAGRYGELPEPSGRLVLGWDYAGRIDAVGPHVDASLVGITVTGWRYWFDTREGTQADYIVVPIESATPCPSSLSPAALTTLPLNGNTAFQALELLGLQRGDTLAILGAAGGIGGFAMDLAVHRGIAVAGIADDSDRNFIEGRGGHFISRTSRDVAGCLRRALRGPADALIATAPVDRSVLAGIEPGGAAVSAVGERPANSGLDWRFLNAHPNTDQTVELVRMAERGEIALRVAGTIPFEDAAEAHRAAARPGTRGRYVLTSTERR